MPSLNQDASLCNRLASHPWRTCMWLLPVCVALPSWIERII